jgi:hypothetical protein
VCASGLYAAGAWWLVFNPGERQQLLRAFRGNRALKPGVAAAVGEAVQ